MTARALCVQGRRLPVADRADDGRASLERWAATAKVIFGPLDRHGHRLVSPAPSLDHQFGMEGSRRLQRLEDADDAARIHMQRCQSLDQVPNGG